MLNENDNGRAGIYRVSSQFWFRPALALLVAVLFVIPGGAVLAGAPQVLFLVSLLFWGHVAWAVPPWNGLLMYSMLHLGCVVPLWLAISGYRNVRLAIGRKDIPVEEGWRCLKLAKWAVMVLAIGVIGGAAAVALNPNPNNSLGHSLYNQWIFFLFF